MKRIVTSLIFVLLAALVFANVGGPDMYGYRWKDSNDTTGPHYNWIDILPLAGATQVKLLGDDNVRGPFGIGFHFHYYWEDDSMFWVGSNGYIGFNDFSGGQLASPFPTIPNTANPQNFLAIMTADLTFYGATNPALCYYWSNGVDTLIVSFLNVPFWDTTINGYSGSNTFQVILSNVDSSITYQYKEQTGGTFFTPNFMTIGIENYSGVIGLQHSHNTYPPINYAIKFYHPQNPTYTVSDAAVNWNDNTSTGGIFLSQGGNPFTMTTNIANVGNLPLASLNVFCQVLDPNNIVYQQGNANTSALTPGSNETVSISSTFTPAVAGRYAFTTTIPSDGIYTNNSLTQELVVIDTTALLMTLAYDNNVPDPIGISWQGGDGGVGVYFIPPFHPYKIKRVYYYINQNPSLVGFYAKIYKDDGNYHSAGTLLDSIFIDSTQVTAPGWNTVTLPTPIYVNSGGFYVGWYMQGVNIAIATNSDSLICHRTYELLGNLWSTYRNSQTQNFMIRAQITKSITGIDEVAENSLNVGDFYPLPGHDQVSIDLNSNGMLQHGGFILHDLQGRAILNESLGNIEAGITTYHINTTQLSSGIYFGEFRFNEKVFQRKLIIGN